MGSGSRNQLKAVLDTGPIIHLDQIKSLHFLKELDQVIIPQTVHEELKAGKIPQSLEKIEYQIIESKIEDIEGLDKGESEAINILKKKKDHIFFTDDNNAREHAQQNNIRVHGTLGIIALTHARGKITKKEAAKKMRQLQQQSNLYITDEIIEQGIRQLDK